ncbi:MULTISPECIES: dihydrodipicolinate synthase family protein [Paenibacillus]|uniref:dihydrodipicolinate synthase family protein n=1 Tax=Paenibacillus TaxID=44249 RepID=UPI0003D32B10|nr:MULTISPECIES: dihydrodipicolinate synthase family protein [Paenibacillus]AIW40005.1 dihydrodipicolinate synthase [Paenibacillus polymyxa CR1]APB75964.1 dihydrodipicolinate synthase family protein [Paenibacillus polymyxa]OMF68284.1 dihydrodipicolinate synthase family protein [Paenibacillus peoriae]OMF81376.1 dihydrodipicolinate synthase family protein [Paenibacillus peoriae]POR28721.1 dihydrodipicolinate synthase family protein [Paenibacillus polymyxa]
MFCGLSAFPLTPVNEAGINEKAFVTLIQRLVAAGVDSIGALGSTGNYAYLNREERLRVLRLAVHSSEGIPVMTSISAIRTSEVLRLAEDAQRAGASAVLLAPVSYQALTNEEVYSLYEQVTSSLSIPLCVYDNPGTTHFHFSDELHGRIAELPNVRSIKIPGVPSDPEAAKARIRKLRTAIPPHVTIGVSGDSSAVTGLDAGCEVWYSVLGGLFPRACQKMTRLAQSGFAEEAKQLSALLEPLWSLFRQYGSLRVISAAAEISGLISSPSLPLPLQPLNQSAREHLKFILKDLQSTETFCSPFG